MQKILKLHLICLIFFSAGCSWLGILDAKGESPEVYKELLLQHKQRQTEFKKYVGWTKEEIHKEWGKPKKIEFNQPYCINPDGDCIYSKDRVGTDIRFADEEWHYGGVLKSKTQHYSYSVIFYFVDGKVVQVDTA